MRNFPQYSVWLEALMFALLHASAKVAVKVKQMSSATGVDGFEQCAAAVREQGPKVEEVLPQIHVAGNGFVSLMSYQAKGYAHIAP